MVLTELEQALADVTARGQPYETLTITLGDVDFIGFKNAPKNLRELYRASLRHEGDFYVYENERFSYQEAWSLAAKVANRLLDLGIKPGDRVGISLRNYPEWIWAFMGITAMGGVAVAMNAWWTAEEMQYGIDDSGLKLIFVDEERLLRMNEVRSHIPLVLVRVNDDRYETFHEFIDGMSAEMPDSAITPEDNATLLYTSGSTAHPKGVLSTHRAITNALLGWEAGGIIGYRAGVINGSIKPPTNPAPARFKPATILSVPLFHVTGLTVQLLQSFRSGRKLVGMYKWDVEDALNIIERERITSFNGVPTMAYELVQSKNLENHDLSSLQSAGGGGAAMAPEQAREIDKKISRGASGTGWGMTETQGLATGIGGDAYRARPRSCGRAVPPIVKVKAIDENGRELPPNATGELCIWGIMNFKAYWNNENATRDALVDGWVHTGDIGHLDDDGYVFITDRKKDIVIRGGENIGCQEVEAALLEHPDVREVCVFGVPHKRLGETVACVLSLEENSTIDTDALIGFAKERLAYHKVPEFIELRRDRLPRTASEKIFKRQIRDEFISKLT